MNVRQRHIAYFFLALIDVALIVGCYLFTSWYYANFVRPVFAVPFAELPFWNLQGFVLLVIYACALVAGYALRGVYGCMYLGFIRKMSKRILIVNVTGVVLLVLALYILDWTAVSRVTLLLAFLLSTFVIFLKEWLTIQVLLYRRKGAAKSIPVLVVGCGPLAQKYANAVAGTPSRLEHVVGYIAVDDSVSEARIQEECPLLRTRFGTVDDLEHILAMSKVEEIVIALEAEQYPCIAKVAAMADKFGTRFMLVPFYSEIMPRKPETDSISGVRLVNLRSTPLERPINAFVKRVFDVLVGSFVILITSWLMLIAVIGVKVSSPGPILFKQERTGMNGRTFQMLKFRSMRMADDPVSTFTEDKDARKTKFGSFIRKFSIDELPQFFNVVKGDIAAVTRNKLVVKPQVSSLRAFEESVNSFCQNVHTVFERAFSSEKAVA